MNKIIHGNCLEKLKTIKENSVDSIVTDPPYELGFMGKSWDNSGIAYNIEMWRECFRVLKPGGHLLSFGGTRTYHRMACAIEDAGFEIRDMIEWVYGSGFPKSYNIGKSVSKLIGEEREYVGEYNNHRDGSVRKVKTCNNILKGKKVGGMQAITKGTSEWEGWGTALKPAHEPICMARKPLSEKTVAENVLKYGTGGINIDESRVGIGTGKETEVEYPDIRGDNYQQGKTVVDNGRFPANLIHDNSEEVRECFPETKSGKDCFRKNPHQTNAMAGTLNTLETEEISYGDQGNASRFFKSIPAHEPICMARKPLSEKTVAENVLKYGTGGINIDESRIPTTDNRNREQKDGPLPNKYGFNNNSMGNRFVELSTLGRFPANLIHDNSEEVRECFPETGKSTGGRTIKRSGGTYVGGAGDNVKNWTNDDPGFGDSGNASRFFKSIIYTAKASKSERNKGCEGLEGKQKSSMSGRRNADDMSGYKIDNDVTGRFVTSQQNNHPTVKPIALMEYLIKMITPKGGIVLDPFAGSGTTLVAAKKNGFQYIGIEMIEEYIPIIQYRVDAVKDETKIFDFVNKLFNT